MNQKEYAALDREIRAGYADLGIDADNNLAALVAAWEDITDASADRSPDDRPDFASYMCGWLHASEYMAHTYQPLRRQPGRTHHRR
jgi:hypothetical protein